MFEHARIWILSHGPQDILRYAHTRHNSYDRDGEADCTRNVPVTDFLLISESVRDVVSQHCHRGLEVLTACDTELSGCIRPAALGAATGGC